MKWLLFCLAACGTPVHSPDMAPGENCLQCHATGDHVWTVAGTVFDDPNADVTQGVSEAEVLITDSNGKALTLHTTGAGNFYTAEKLAYPLQVQVQKGQERFEMGDHPNAGACNDCHSSPPKNGAIGRIFIPEAPRSPN